jgi:hypothetical protein
LAAGTTKWGFPRMEQLQIDRRGLHLPPHAPAVAPAAVHYLGAHSVIC